MLFRIILADEMGEEFSYPLEAVASDDAWDTAQMDYPECEVVEVYRVIGDREEV